MNRRLLLVCLVGLPVFGLGRDDCGSLVTDLKLPVKLKTRGKPVRARWEQVDKVVTELRNRVQGRECEWTFGQVLRSRKEKLYFPLTNNVLRTAPEKALEGLNIFDQEGVAIGEYERRVAYERRGALYAKKSYTLYFFQYRDAEGDLYHIRNRLLLDSYLVKWDDLKERTIISKREQ